MMQKGIGKGFWSWAMAFAGLAWCGPVQAAPLTASVAAWGTNNAGQVAVPPGLTNIMAVAGGAFHSLAVRSDGTVVGWGDTNYNKHLPPANLQNVAAVAAGYGHSVALRADGTVAAWGQGESGQTNVPAFPFAVLEISAGEHFTMARLANGKIALWGAVPFNTPSELTNAGNQEVFVTAVAAGGDHCVAVKQDLVGRYTVSAWPRIDNNLSRPPMELTNGNTIITMVAAGASHCLALKADGTVVGWGSNLKGQINVPAGLSGVVRIAARANHSLALKADGTVVAWGENDFGQTSVPANLARAVAIAAGNTHSLALYWEPVAIASHPPSQTVIQGGTAVLSVAASGSQPITYQWQRNGTNLPQATNAVLTLSNVQSNQAATYTAVVSNPAGSQTSSGAVLTVLVPPSITAQPESKTVPQGNVVSFSVAVAGTAPFSYRWLKDGAAVSGATGNPLVIGGAQPEDAGAYVVVVTNSAGMVTSQTATLNVLIPPVILAHPQSQTVVAGSSVAFSVVAQGATNYQWRRNGNNIAGANSPTYSLNSAQTNDAGTYTVAVSNGGGTVVSQGATLTVLPGGESFNLVAWGRNPVIADTNFVDVTPPGGLSNAVAIAVGGHHGLVLRRDGTVVGWGDNSQGQSSTAGLSGIKAIAAGFKHSLGLRTNGTVTGWGLNDRNQTSVPVGLNGVKAIASGAHHGLALRTNGVVAAWGDNSRNQVAPLPALTNVVAIAAGLEHSLALLANGTVVGWGANDDAQALPPPGLTNVTAIAAGYYHSLALKSDGTVVGWGAARGLYNYGQANPPAALKGVVAIAAGDTHSLALLSDNRVVAWGNNNYGQAAPPDGLTGVAAIAAGPQRSLALRLKTLRLLRPAFSGGLPRLTIANTDSSPLEAERLPRIAVWSATNAGLGVSGWSRLTNSLSLTNGQAVMLDAPGAAAKFYRVIESP